MILEWYIYIAIEINTQFKQYVNTTLTKHTINNIKLNIYKLDIMYVFDYCNI